MSIEIRAMEKSDWGEIIEIYYQAIKSNMDTFEYDCPSYAQWDERALPFARLVAEDDDGLAGWAYLKPYSERDYYKGVSILSINIDQNHRNKGVGELLLNELIEKAVSEGIWSIQAHILQENTPSLKLLEKCGFRQVGVNERLAKDRFGVWRSVVIMEYRIQTDIAGGCDCEKVKQMQAENKE